MEKKKSSLLESFLRKEHCKDSQEGQTLLRMPTAEGDMMGQDTHVAPQGPDDQLFRAAVIKAAVGSYDL